MNSAILSPCLGYRYRLDRDVYPGQKLRYAFFGVNPSTADAETDDHTIRKLTGFCRLWGARGFVVANAFAFRSTDVTALAGCIDPVGPGCYAHLCDVIADADVLVPCWGNRAKVPQQLRPRFAFVKELLFGSGKPVKVFGLTQSGDPMHPLMLPYTTILKEWKP